MTPVDKFVAGAVSTTFQSPHLVLVVHRPFHADAVVLRLVHMDKYYKQTFNSAIRQVSDMSIEDMENPYKSGEWLVTAMLREIMGMEDNVQSV